jgi:prophage antirepressor-like protein
VPVAGALAAFAFEGAPIRVIDQGGVPWFVAADVARALGIANSRDALAGLDLDEKGVALTDTPGGQQYAQVVSESGLFALILRSRRATTPGSVPHRFRRWVTAEVLPAIRRDGGYITGEERVRSGAMSDDELVLRALAVLQTKVARLAQEKDALAVQHADLAAERAMLATRAGALARLEASDGSRSLTVAAKELRVPPRELIRVMAARGWIYRRSDEGEWVGYQHRIAAGMLEHRPAYYRDRRGVERSRTQVLMTGKGLATLATMLPRQKDVDPDCGRERLSDNRSALA